MTYLLDRALRDRCFQALRQELLNILGQPPASLSVWVPGPAWRRSWRADKSLAETKNPVEQQLHAEQVLGGSNFLLGNFFSSYLWQRCAQFPLQQLVSDQRRRQRAAQDRQAVRSDTTVTSKRSHFYICDRLEPQLFKDSRAKFQCAKITGTNSEISLYVLS